MTQESELERLEAVIVKLLSKYDTLSEEKRDLEETLSVRESEIVELKSELDSVNSVKGDMTSRVQGLLGQIEDWEASLDEDTGENEIVEESEESEDADSRVQHNLFNVNRQVEGDMG